MFRSICGATLVVVGGVIALSPVGGGASAADGCTSTTYTWSGDQLLVWGGGAVFATGVTIPTPSAGETLVVSNATYRVYDRYADGASPTRVESAQQRGMVHST